MRKAIKTGALFILLAAIIVSMVGFSAFSVGAADSSALAKTGAQQVKYLNGDADGDGYVTIIDVTVIQRFLVNAYHDADGMLKIRGDVDKNGLDITDATYIQRYLAQIGNPYQVGKALFYTPQDGGEVTPTRDPDELPEDIV